MFIKYIKQPYPLGNNSWLLIISISLFVALFMLIFQPFGLASVQESAKLFVLGGYGLVTFGVLALCLKGVSRLLGRYYSEESWTVEREILWHIFLISMIGLANSVYSIYFNFGTFSILTILHFQLFTFAIAIIPVVVLVFINQNRLLSQNLKIAFELSSQMMNIVQRMVRFPKMSSSLGLIVNAISN